jgi:hypothetical protein
MLQVSNHKQFALFEYENEPCDTFQLGDVLFKPEQDGDSPEIGVVIQTFSDGDVRTDMWGMCSPSEVTSATYKDVAKYRKDLLNHLNFIN